MEQREYTYSGSICAVDYHGTVILIWIAAADGETTAIPFDHRSFQLILQSEDCCAAELLGRRAAFDGGQFFFTD